MNKVLASKFSGSRLPISEEELIKSMWREAIILLYLVLAVCKEIYCCEMLISGKKDAEVQQKTKMCHSRDVIFIRMQHHSVILI